MGFAAAFQSVQDDHSGPGADVLPSPEDDRVFADQGIVMADAKLAQYMLSLECDTAALDAALANSTISMDYFEDSMRSIRNNYNQLIIQETGMTAANEEME